MNHYMDFEYSYIDFEYSDIHLELFSREGICINKYLGSETSVIVPTQIDDLPVTSIGGGILTACTLLRNINLLSKKLFRDKYFLYEIIDSCNVRINSFISTNAVVSIPSFVNNFNVISIGDSAFYGCKSLRSITIPDSVTSIGDEAFSGCESLERIKIPDSVTSIGDEAFSGCESLGITFHESMKNTFLLDSIDETGDYDEI